MFTATPPSARGRRGTRGRNCLGREPVGPKRIDRRGRPPRDTGSPRGRRRRTAAGARPGPAARRGSSRAGGRGRAGPARGTPTARGMRAHAPGREGRGLAVVASYASNEGEVLARLCRAGAGCVALGQGSVEGAGARGAVGAAVAGRGGGWGGCGRPPGWRRCGGG